MEQEKILRINELAKKKKEVGLTDEETRERSALYAQYIKEFREQTEATLKRVRVEQEDGSYAVRINLPAHGAVILKVTLPAKKDD